MQKSSKRYLVGTRGKSYLRAPRMQSRFIIFLIFLLIAYSVLLMVFQKLSAIVQFPLFLPITLVTLLIFIGLVGVIYSHTFAGPIHRIRGALEKMAEGERDITLRLRDSDDPMLKELARALGRMCENSRSSQVLIEETAGDLMKSIAKLRESVGRGADIDEVRKMLEELRANEELLDKAIKSSGGA